MIYGDNGIFMKWTEWFYSNDQSSLISYLLLCMLTGELVTNERPGMLDPDQSEAGRGSSRWSRSSITLRSSPCESGESAKALTEIRVSKKSIKLSYFLLNKYLLSDEVSMLSVLSADEIERLSWKRA